MQATLELQLEDTLQLQKLVETLESMGIKADVKTKLKKKKTKQKKYTMEQMFDSINDYWQKNPDKKKNLKLTQTEIDLLSNQTVLKPTFSSNQM
jgi:hypothetical protein